MDQEELLQCYDEQENPTESRPVSEVKRVPPKHWCGVASVWLVNDQAQVLCSKRSATVSSNPGRWQTYFGGHVAAGATFSQTAVKELLEEAGIVATEQALHPVTEGRYENNKQHYKCYALRFNGQPSDLQFNDGEVTEVKWLDLDEYWREREAHPDSWCNSCQPDAQALLRSWIAQVNK